MSFVICWFHVVMVYTDIFYFHGYSSDDEDSQQGMGYGTGDTADKEKFAR